MLNQCENVLAVKHWLALPRSAEYPACTPCQLISADVWNRDLRHLTCDWSEALCSSAHGARTSHALTLTKRYEHRAKPLFAHGAVRGLPPAHYRDTKEKARDFGNHSVDRSGTDANRRPPALVA
jgi:hypothetical protein